MGANLRLKEEKISFLRKQSHDLKSLLRSVTKETEDAVAIIVKCMESKDEKMRFAAASKLLDMRKDLAVTINTDDIQRMLLESKNPDRVKNLVPEDDDTPQIDFTGEDLN